MSIEISGQHGDSPAIFDIFALANSRCDLTPDQLANGAAMLRAAVAGYAPDERVALLAFTLMKLIDVRVAKVN